jgi:hypothetical protein
MTPLKNGGPALPVPNLEDDEDFNGMTLRDYFAAKAMVPFIEVTADDAAAVNENPHVFAAAIASAAYIMADAMLAARSAK